MVAGRGGPTDRAAGSTASPTISAPSAPGDDLSRGWEVAAEEFIAARERSRIGADTVRAWARHLPDGGSVLDLGCGSGVPVSQALIDSGLRVWGVDASPSMAAEFARRCPRATVACEPVETSSFFGRRFDGIVAIGLMFLLPADAQRGLIARVALALNADGRFLFTCPAQACAWADLMTGRESRSLGEPAYVEVLREAGLVLAGRGMDEGGNHYFHAHRPR